MCAFHGAHAAIEGFFLKTRQLLRKDLLRIFVYRALRRQAADQHFLLFQIVNGILGFGQAAIEDKDAATVWVAHIFERGEAHVAMLLGGDVAYNVVGVIAHAELGDDAGGVDDLGGEDDSLAEVVLVGVVGVGALGVHVGDANAALLVGLETLASGDIVEECASHVVDVAEEVDEFIGLVGEAELTQNLAHDGKAALDGVGGASAYRKGVQVF